MTGLSMISPQLFVAKDPNHLGTIGFLRQSNREGARLSQESKRFNIHVLPTPKSTANELAMTQSYLTLAINLLVARF